MSQSHPQSILKYKMEESKNLYKSFQGKKCLIITNSNFKYNTKYLEVFEDKISFIDNRGNKTVISFSEIQFIQEVNNDN